MKKIFLFVLVSIITQIASADPSDFIPAAATSEKLLSNYTVSDIVGGAFAFKNNLDDSHPFKKVNISEDQIKKIKKEWPGSKLTNNVDEILTYIVHTENRDQERYATIGIYWLIHEIMDVSCSEKADAFMRVYHAQTEGLKKRKVAFMAARLFPYLADERMLLPLKEMLDDETTYRFHKAEGIPPEPETTRLAARQMFIRFLSDKNLLSADFPKGEVLMSASDCKVIFNRNLPEAESCALLKAWLTDHWQEVADQAAKARANENRVYGKPPSLSLITPISKWKVGQWNY